MSLIRECHTTHKYTLKDGTIKECRYVARYKVKPPKITPEMSQLIASLYKQGMSLVNISNKVGVSVYLVKKELVSLGVYGQKNNDVVEDTTQDHSLQGPNLKRLAGQADKQELVG
jgi:hypothetical protein